MKLDLAPQAGRVTRTACTLPDGRALSWHLAACDAFDPQRFTAERIAMPASLARAAPSRQASFFFGRLCARAALSELGVVDAEVGIDESGAPRWPPGTTGSISHTSTLAAAVALPAHVCRGVGIDVEDLVQSAHARDLAGVAVSAEEQALLPPQLDRGTALLLVFSAKESFYKAVHAAAGRFFDFDALELTAMEQGTLAFRVTEPLGADWPAGATCRVGYALGAAHLATAFVW